VKEFLEGRTGRKRELDGVIQRCAPDSAHLQVLIEAAGAGTCIPGKYLKGVIFWVSRLENLRDLIYGMRLW
jgi:hypothetical protein